MRPSPLYFLFFFFNDTATTEIYTLSLHDALPICASVPHGQASHLGTHCGERRGFDPRRWPRIGACGGNRSHAPGGVRATACDTCRLVEDHPLASNRRDRKSTRLNSSHT